MYSMPMQTSGTSTTEADWHDGAFHSRCVYRLITRPDSPFYTTALCSTLPCMGPSRCKPSNRKSRSTSHELTGSGFSDRAVALCLCQNMLGFMKIWRFRRADTNRKGPLEISASDDVAQELHGVRQVILASKTAVQTFSLLRRVPRSCKISLPVELRKRLKTILMRCTVASHALPHRDRRQGGLKRIPKGPRPSCLPCRSTCFESAPDL